MRSFEELQEKLFSLGGMAKGAVAVTKGLLAACGLHVGQVWLGGGKYSQGQGSCCG